jgi:hypothetical protein
MFEKTWPRVLLVTLALTSESAGADLTGVWRLQGGEQMQVDYRDNDNIRMGVDEDNYQLLSSGRLYAVSRDNDQWQVVDMEAMTQQMKTLGLGKVFNQQQIKGGETEDEVQFRATGRTETVGGITGDIYEITVREPSGRVETAEAVLADNEQVVTLQRAMALIAARHVEAWSGKRTTQAFDAFSRAAQQQKRGALLRYEQEIRLVSINADSLPDTRFQLPENARVVDTTGQGDAEDRPDISEAIDEGMEKLKGLFGR